MGAGMADPYLNTAEVAELVRTVPATVRYWRHVGKGPRGVKIGRRVLYRESDVREWIERQYDRDGQPAA